MITTEVNSEQIENWKKIYSENKNNLVVNRISDKELNDYFVEKYHPNKEAPSQFVDTVILNAKENGKQEPIISAYILAGNIYVGIDLNTGFFQVECEDIDKMKIIWDDLFIVRGLSEEDIENFVIAAQYILLHVYCILKIPTIAEGNPKSCMRIFPIIAEVFGISLRPQ